MKRILVTGAAGFIGMHLSKKLLELGFEVIGLDNISDYYSVQLKQDRLAVLSKYAQFTFHKTNLHDLGALKEIFKNIKVESVVNLAAQAGVRYSLTHPHVYIQSNIEGFLNILECCRAYPVEHLIYASSSSVYGNNTKVPFSETDRVDKPVSLYAATKKSNELMAESYSHLYGMPLTGLRFFTVYGPWGRPDMAPYLFTSAILKGEKIKVFNYGKNWRDFTFVDDIVDGIFKVLMSPQPTGHRIFNIGNNCPVTVLDFIKALEEISGRKADLEMLPAQPGDVLATHANIDSLNAAVGYMPTTDLRKGLEKFVDWYRKYYHL